MISMDRKGMLVRRKIRGESSVEVVNANYVGCRAEPTLHARLKREQHVLEGDKGSELIAEALCPEGGKYPDSQGHVTDDRKFGQRLEDTLPVTNARRAIRKWPARDVSHPERNAPKI